MKIGPLDLDRRWKIFLIVAPITCILDQITKIWARATLPHIKTGTGIIGEPVKVISNYWDWRLSENPGSAFGMFGQTTGSRIFLSIIGIVALFAIIWMLRKAKEEQTRLIWALGLVAGGAVGNLIDRIAFGVVTDFIVWKYNTHEWPTFNVADIALVVGVGLLFIDIGKDSFAPEDDADDDKKSKAKKDPPKPDKTAGMKSKSKGKKKRKK